MVCSDISDGFIWKKNKWNMASPHVVYIHYLFLPCFRKYYKLLDMVVKWDSFFLFGKRLLGIHSSVERYWTTNLSIFYTHSNGQKLRRDYTNRKI